MLAFKHMMIFISYYQVEPLITPSLQTLLELEGIILLLGISVVVPFRLRDNLDRATL